MFCRFGDLQSVRVLPDKYCAFVNFFSTECAGRAMQGLQVLESVNSCIVLVCGVWLSKDPCQGPAASWVGKVAGPESCNFQQTAANFKHRSLCVLYSKC